jgi:hypothetical protein
MIRPYNYIMFRRGAQFTQIINAVEMSTGNLLSVDNEGSMIACG